MPDVFTCLNKDDDDDDDDVTVFKGATRDLANPL